MAPNSSDLGISKYLNGNQLIKKVAGCSPSADWTSPLLLHGGQAKAEEALGGLGGRSRTLAAMQMCPDAFKVPFLTF